jgi:hypothetical protein
MKEAVENIYKSLVYAKKNQQGLYLTHWDVLELVDELTTLVNIIAVLDEELRKENNESHYCINNTD